MTPNRLSPAGGRRVAYIWRFLRTLRIASQARQGSALRADREHRLERRKEDSVRLSKWTPRSRAVYRRLPVPTKNLVLVGIIAVAADDE